MIDNALDNGDNALFMRLQSFPHSLSLPLPLSLFFFYFCLFTFTHAVFFLLLFFSNFFAADVVAAFALMQISTDKVLFKKSSKTCNI